MGIEVTRNQPIQTKFSKHYGCDHYELMQLVQQNDEQRVQVRCTPRVLPVAFPINSWTLAGSASHNTGTNAFDFVGPGSVNQVLTLTPGKRYQIDFDVEINTLGSTGGYRVAFENYFVMLPDTTSPGAYSVLSGRVSAVVTAAFNAQNFGIGVSGASTNLSIKNICVTELSNVNVAVLDKSKNVVYTLTGPQHITNDPRSNITDIYVPWWLLALSDGIYYLSFYDTTNLGTEILANGEFVSNLDSWKTKTGGVSSWQPFFTSEEVARFTTGNNGNDIAQDVYADGGAEYELQFDVVITMPGQSINVYFVVNGTATEPVNYTANGLHTQVLDLTAYEGIVAVKVVLEAGMSIGTMVLNSVSLMKTKDLNNISNPFELARKQAQTLHLLGYCNREAFGFTFKSFVSSVRAKGFLKYKEYPDFSTAEIFRLSNEAEELLTARAPKHYEVTIHGTAEYIHDAIRLMRLCDLFLIDGKRWILAGDYELVPTEGIMNATARFTVREQIGIPPNRYLSGSSNVFNYLEEGYVDEDYFVEVLNLLR